MVFLPAGRQGSINNCYGFYLYLVSQNRANWSYVGSTSDIEKRFKNHTYGKVRSTKGCRPLKLVHTEEFATVDEARARELYLKSGIGREEKKKIIYSQIV